MVLIGSRRAARSGSATTSFWRLRLSLDKSNLNSNTSRVSSRDAPWCPPIVEMSGGMVGHLLAWEMHERDGSWHAWVSWVQETGGRHVRKVVDVRAGLQPLESPDAYSAVPRRVRGSDGLIRPWSGESGLRPGPPIPARVGREPRERQGSGLWLPRMRSRQAIQIG